jgi:ornithine--oxo-acid transaminase
MHENVKPDIMMVGKALGGGVYPVSAALASKDVMSVIGPGEHGSTFGGNPLACAVAMAALDVLVDENLGERSEVLGERFRKGLSAIGSTEKLKDLGVLAKETHETTIRFAPPLTIEEDQIDWLVEMVAKALE